MRLTVEKISHYADVLAIPFFIWGFIYFWSIRNRSLQENILMIWCAMGLILDGVFTTSRYIPIYI